MFTNALFASAVLALASTVVEAQTDEQKEMYKNWAAQMSIFRYDWQPYEIKTDDGYTLTMFNVTKATSYWKKHNTKEPIVIVPDLGRSSAVSVGQYMVYTPIDNPLQLQLLEAGHDLWFLDTRGTGYSLKHDTLSSQDSAFWDFDIDEIGQKDLKAAMDFVYTKTGKKTGIYTEGLSFAAALAGITKDYAWFKERTYKLVTKSPCTIVTKESIEFLTADTLAAMQAMDIAEIGGPTWYKTAGKLTKLLGLPAMGYFEKAGVGKYIKGIPLKGYNQMAQNTSAGFFQTYGDDFWAKGGGPTTGYDLYTIKDIPVGMFMGTKETQCIMSQNDITRAEIGAMVQSYKTYDANPMQIYNGKDLQKDMIDFLSAEFTPAATFLQ